MSTPNQARIEFGTAGSNIAGNIDALLPQLAARGAEVAKAGNQIHDYIVQLRQTSEEFKSTTSDTIEEVAFDRSAENIKRILPQLSGHGSDVDTIAAAIKGYCNQLETLHAQHLHLVDENAAVVAGLPLVNNGVGSGPFETGTTPVTQPASAAKIDPNPKPAGTGVAALVVDSTTEPGKAIIVDPTVTN